MLPSDIYQNRSAVDFFFLIQGLVLLQMTWKKKENSYWKFTPQQQQQKFIRKKCRGFCKAEEHTGTFLLQEKCTSMKQYFLFLIYLFISYP
jgi:hypothetical protein